ncbi:MAG: J domain-containing protein [Spirochaetales bacterium]
MTLEEALAFMQVSPSTSLSELEAAYRTLIKLYHPDRNQHRLEWSHRMTLQLNEAYTLIRETKNEGKVVPPINTPPPPTPKRIQKELRQAWHYIEEGIHLYYIYGLENLHIRQNGSFHIKYILSLKNIKKGKEILEIWEKEPLCPEDREELTMQKKFCEAFLQNMQIEKTFIADGSIHHKAYQHYYNGSRLLDTFIKKVFFPQDFKNLLLPPKCSALCEKEFLTVLLHYQQSTWVGEAAIKLSVLESLLRIINHRTGMNTRS